MAKPDPPARFRREFFNSRVYGGCQNADFKPVEFGAAAADQCGIADLRVRLPRGPFSPSRLMRPTRFLRYVTGGAGFVFTGENDTDIMPKSPLISLAMPEACHRRMLTGILFSAWVCMYPDQAQMDPDYAMTAGGSAFLSHPDSE